MVTNLLTGYMWVYHKNYIKPVTCLIIDKLFKVYCLHIPTSLVFLITVLILYRSLDQCHLLVRYYPIILSVGINSLHSLHFTK